MRGKGISATQVAVLVLIILCGTLAGEAIAGFPIDPNMTVWYMFDETDGNTAYDSSGYDRHAAVTCIDCNVDWDPNDGRYGGSLGFDDDTSVAVPNDVLASIDNQISVTLWLKCDWQEPTDNYLFDAGNEEFRIQAGVLADSAGIFWRAGNDTNDVLTWDLGGFDRAFLLGQWHNWLFVKDQSQEKMTISLSGRKVAEKDNTDMTLVNIDNAPFRIGSLISNDGDFSGRLDDFRVFDLAYHPTPIPDPYIAWNPNPKNEQDQVQPDVVLSWLAGDDAVWHDVYLGTGFDDVSDANTSSSEHKGRQNLENTTYNPGGLELNTTYYWRIDEVNDACAASPRKGRIWNFTTANYVVIDDFESYNDDDNELWYTWLEDASAWLYLGVDPCDPVHGGEQSMCFLYFNDWDFGPGYYSEVGKALGGMDFTEADVKILTVFFYGNSGNAASASEEPYVGLSDGSGYDQVEYSPISDIQLQEWTEWNIVISDFNALTLTAIETIYIGFGDRTGAGPQGGEGEVFFDDVCLYPARCVPGPWFPDITGDCVVDYKDLRLIANNWLDEGYTDSDVSGDGEVNFEDVAVLGNYWLEDNFWPE